jgi:hypothetical protein
VQGFRVDGCAVRWLAAARETSGGLKFALDRNVEPRAVTQASLDERNAVAIEVEDAKKHAAAWQSLVQRSREVFEQFRLRMLERRGRLEIDPKVPPDGRP